MTGELGSAAVAQTGVDEGVIPGGTRPPGPPKSRSEMDSATVGRPIATCVPPGWNQAVPAQNEVAEAKSPVERSCCQTMPVVWSTTKFSCGPVDEPAEYEGALQIREGWEV